LKVTATQRDVVWQGDGQSFTISPGDYLIGDLNGVVLLPMRLAPQILPLMQKQVEADEKMAKAIVEDGMSFAEASGRFRG
jgi:regulator of RNase E activity RraA